MEPELASVAERRQGCSKNPEQPRISVLSSLTPVTSLELPITYENTAQKEGKTVPFPLSLPLLLSELKAENTDRVSVYQEVK